jgi:hypothetical protein
MEIDNGNLIGTFFKSLYYESSKPNYCWRVSSSGIWRRVVHCVSTDVSEEHIASIFRVEEIGSAKPASKQVASSSETSFETQRTARHHISEDDTLYNHRCENLKSYKLLLFETCVSGLYSILHNSYNFSSNTSTQNTHTHRQTYLSEQKVTSSF